MAWKLGPICLELESRRKQTHEPIWSRGSKTKSLECACLTCNVVSHSGSDGDDLMVVETASGLRNRYNDKEYTEYFALQEGPFCSVAKSISGRTDSEKCASIMRGWLQSCSQLHKALCSKETVKEHRNALPPRVIEINLLGEPLPRLIQTSNEQDYYVCLSHSWGGYQPIQTTRDPDTLSLYQKGIPWLRLPRTFRDAIEVTRKLGFRYIWIDSLCIVQDDRSDWEAQSSQMKNIYGNATLTIAASASASPDDGLFRTADPKHIDRALTANEIDHGKYEAIRVRVALNHDVANFPLLQRAWVFQERMLSRRFLHFGDSELMWECMEQSACECGLLDYPIPIHGDLEVEWLSPKNSLHPDKLRLLQDDSSGLSKIWNDAVRDYSRARLTKPSDIFPALSGIARSFADATGWTYLAGMWKETLINNLAWVSNTPSDVRRCTDWRSPSWSWASLVERENISHFTHCHRGAPRISDVLTRRFVGNIVHSATIVETYVQSVGADEMGELQDGYIILSGIMVQAILQKSESGFTWGLRSPTGDVPCFEDTLYEDFRFGEEEDDDDDDSEEEEEEEKRKERGGEVKGGDDVFCLKLFDPFDSESSPTKGSCYMVMRKAASNSRNVIRQDSMDLYERIGMFEVEGDRKSLEDYFEEQYVQRNAVVKII